MTCVNDLPTAAVHIGDLKSPVSRPVLHGSRADVNVFASTR